MAVGTDSPVVTEYLQRLQAAAAGLPAGRRAELVAEIRAHVAEALEDAGRDDETTVREILDRLGEPVDIVAAESEGPGGSVAQPAPQWAPSGGGAAVPVAAPPPYVAAPRSPWGTVEVLAIVGLTVGSVVLPVIGLLAGVLFVWMSQQWSRREKVVATLWAVAAPLLVVLIAFFALLAVRVEGSSSSTVIEAPQPVPSAVATP